MGGRNRSGESEVVCDLLSIMSESEPSTPEVRVFMTEEEVLWHELEHGLSQQGSSSEGNPFADIPSARVMSQTGAGPSGRVTEGVDSDDDEAEVDSEETEILAAAKALDAESDLESYPGEGMLLKNPRSSVATEDIRLWRYLYGIPPSVEVRVPTAHERVDWVVPGWVAIYELMLKDGMRFLFGPNLVFPILPL